VSASLIRGIETAFTIRVAFAIISVAVSSP
jgi:hypothetical protein